MAQASVMGYITTSDNTNTTPIYNSNYTNGQYEEVEYPRRDTITIQTEGPVTIDQIFTYFDNLSLLDQVACIQKIPDQNPIYEITVKQGNDALLFQREVFKNQPVKIGGHEIKLIQTKKLKDIIKSPMIRVQIYEAPYELQDRHILQKLAPFGVMARNELFSHKYRGTDIYNGVRTATYSKITKPIPTVLFVRGNRIKIKYESQDRTPICGICRTKGHFRDDCPRLREVRNLGELIEPGKTLPVNDIRQILKEQEEEGKEQERRKQEDRVRRHRQMIQQTQQERRMEEERKRQEEERRNQEEERRHQQEEEKREEEKLKERMEVLNLEKTQQKQQQQQQQQQPEIVNRKRVSEKEEEQTDKDPEEEEEEYKEVQSKKRRRKIEKRRLKKQMENLVNEEELKKKEETDRQTDKSSTSEEDYYTDTDATTTETEDKDIPDSYPPCGQPTNQQTQQLEMEDIEEMEEKSIWAKMVEREERSGKMTDWSADEESKEWN